MHDLACVIHLHSLHSDGTGTVRQIVRAGRRAGVDVVMLTDHDTLEARRQGDEGWHDGVLLLVGEEVSPPRRDHCLAFGVDTEIDNSLDAEGILRAIQAAGGLCVRRPPLLARLAPLQARRRRHAVRRARLRRAARHRALELRDRHGGDVREPPRGAALRGRARTRARPPARAQPERVGPPLPPPARGGHRRAGRPPDRQAHRPVRAAAADGLPPLLPLPPHPRALPRAADAATSSTIATRCTRRCATGAATWRWTRSARRAASRSRRERSRWGRRPRPASTRCARTVPAPADLRLLRDGEPIATAGRGHRAGRTTCASRASTESRPGGARTGGRAPGSSRIRSTCDEHGSARPLARGQGRGAPRSIGRHDAPGPRR